MQWHFENWNDMKHELWKFWSVTTIFLIYAKLVPYSLTPPYGHLYNTITDNLFGPKNANNHSTFPTSVIHTPL